MILAHSSTGIFSTGPNDAYAGIVDQDVEAAEPRFRCPHQSVDLFGPAHVAGSPGDRVGMGLLQLRQRPVDATLPRATNEYAGAAVKQRL